MIDPTLTVTIDRTSLSLPALVLSGSADANVLGLVEFQPPALQARIAYAPDVGGVHGSEPMSWSWQESILGFSWFRDGATSETVVQAAVVEVLAAITQWPYTVTTQVSGAPAQVWSARPGSLVPSERTYSDLVHLTPVYAVTIPVYPIPS